MSRRDSCHDHLTAEGLSAALRNPHIGNRIVVVEETASTNDLIWKMAQEGAEDGVVVFAERQTAGRGQRGNRWESAPHLGLWFSILLRPKIGPTQSARLTTWVAQTLAKTVQEELRIGAAIKLPNDIYIGNRKVGGVLVEMRVEKAGRYLAIAGIGVNVNHGVADFSDELRERAGSLAMATGKRIDRRAFAIALLRNLDQSYRALLLS